MSAARHHWPGGEAQIQALGGMIAPVRLSLPDGRVVEPLARAPWIEAPDPSWPGILRGLQGDFACVPFGTGDPAPLPDRWRALGVTAPEVAPPHGFGANEVWDAEAGDEGLRARIAYPAASPIAALERRLCPLGPDRVEMALTILPRQDTELPVALHPIFRLSPTPGQSELRLGQHGAIWTHPCGSSDAPCPLLPDAQAQDLSTLPGRDRRSLDYSHLPLPEPAESRLLVTGTNGRATLAHLDEGWSATLEWDASLLPSLMLWVSNRGRTAAPWNGRHLALGMEPCAAAFDLGEAASRGPSPLTEAGVVTALKLRAGEPVTIRTALSVALL